MNKTKVIKLMSFMCAKYMKRICIHTWTFHSYIWYKPDLLLLLLLKGKYFYGQWKQYWNTEILICAYTGTLMCGK